MTKLEQLIQELCPNGVEYKTIGELSSYRRGSFPQPYGKSEWYDGEGSMPFVQVADIGNDMRLISDTKRKISALAQPKSVFAPKGSIVISLQGSIGRIAITQYDAYIDRTVAIFNKVSKALINKYFVYQLQRIFGIKERTARGSTIKTITKEEFTSFLIPVPPLEVQAEIVRILDKFTELTTELATELANRKKQYEYYRDELLPFNREDAEWKPLGDICTIVRGASPRPIKNFVTNDANGVNWIKIGDVQPGAKYITSCAEKITEEGAKKSRAVKPGDFILSNSMSFGRPYILTIEGCIHDGWLALSDFEEYLTPDYLYHILVSNYVQAVMAQRASFGGAVQNLNADIVRGIEIPLISIEEQKRIVKVLDNFSVFCTDISSGLPAEIEARQKQYEYYRDKLLTFKGIEKND